MTASAPHLDELLGRLGITAEEADGDALRLARRGQTVQVEKEHLHWEDADARSVVAFALLGLRYSLDFFADSSAPPRAAETPLRFRRANLLRYQEVEPEHGDRLPRLVPHITSLIFQHLTGHRPHARPWTIEGLELLAIREKGLSLQVLTDEEFSQVEEDEEDFWEKLRRALFYEAYKRRPRSLPRPEGPDLLIMDSVEGLGATRAHLYPEFDYDLAQDGGLLAIPSRDIILLATGTSEEHHRELQAATEEIFAAALFPLSRARLGIDATSLTPCFTPESPTPLLPVEVSTLFVRT